MFETALITGHPSFMELEVYLVMQSPDTTHDEITEAISSIMKDAITEVGSSNMNLETMVGIVVDSIIDIYQCKGYNESMFVYDC